MTIKKLIKYHQDMLSWQMGDEHRQIHLDAIELLEALVDAISILQER